MAYKIVPLEIEDERTLTAVANVAIKSESGDGAKRTPTFHTIAYNGGPLPPQTVSSDFPFPVIVDLSGMQQRRDQIKIHRDHDITKLIGHGNSRLTATSLEVSGVISASNDHAREVIESAKNGFDWEASIGVSFSMNNIEIIEAGETIHVNGQTFEFNQPVGIIRRSTLREVTFTSLGADPTTTVRLAASRRLTTEDMKMAKEATKTQAKAEAPKKDEFTVWLESRDISPDTLSDATLQAFHSDWSKIQAGETAQALKKKTEESLKSGSISKLEAETFNTQLDNAMAEASDDKKTITEQDVAAHQAKINRLQMETLEHFDRMQLVQANLAEHPDLARQAIAEKWDESRIRLESLRVKRSRGPAIHTAQGIENIEDDAIACAMVRSMGYVPRKKTNTVTGEEYGWEVWYNNERTLNASDHPALRRLSLHALMDMQIRAVNNNYGWNGDRRSPEFMEAARNACRKLKLEAAAGHTTMSISNIFADVANKTLWAGYQSVNTTWQEWCGVINVPDFKQANVYRLTHTGAYQKMGAGGELQHGGFAEANYTVTADTYGKIVGMTRKHIINDDLGAFNSIMSALGVEGAKSIEEVAYVHLLGNLATIFPVAGTNGNYISGSPGSVLSVTGLNTGTTAFMNQVDADNAPLMLTPDRILVGTALQVTARQLANDQQIRVASGTDTTAAWTSNEYINNPFQGAYLPITSPYLNNTGIKRRVSVDPTVIGTALTGQSATQWFMFVNPNNPQGSTIMMALLNGNQTPTLESADADFNVLGMQFRAYHDFDPGTGDPKLALHSKGAA